MVSLTLFSAIILAIVEAVTEFLPVSSTGHTILAAVILGVDQTPFVKSFELVLEFGSILSVIVLYWRLFLNFEVLKRLIVGVIPTNRRDIHISILQEFPIWQYANSLVGSTGRWHFPSCIRAALQGARHIR